MKNFYLNFELVKEENKIFDFIENLSTLEESSKVCLNKPTANIYIDCIGGENRIAAILYNFFSKSEHDYNFIINGAISSNALLILLALNPKFVSIMRQASSIIHLSNYNIPVATIAFSDYTNQKLKDFIDFKEYNKDLLDLYCLFLSPEELSFIKDGEDIFLSSRRIHNLFLDLKENNDLQLKAKKIFEITL